MLKKRIDTTRALENKAVFSAIPRFGKGLGQLVTTLEGETFSFTANNAKRGEGIQYPDFFSYNGLSKWGAQVGGAVLSFGFGKITDNHLAGEGVGEAVVGGFFKGVVETGSNAAPNLIKDK